MDKEIWKDIKEYEGLYQVSNLGRIKSIKKNKEINLKIRTKSNGYVQVCLYKNSKPKHKSIHRLVAEAFIENINNYPVVNHKDKNKQNNCVDNLEWCTYKYNNEYSLSKKILQYDINNNFIKKWNSAREIERELNIYHNDILKCCKKIYKQAKKYKWKFEGDD